MIKPYTGTTSSLRDPIGHAFEITPDDATDLSSPTRAINVAVTGSVRATMVSGNTATLHIAAGSAFPARVTRIWASGTTATGIVALS